MGCLLIIVILILLGLLVSLLPCFFASAINIWLLVIVIGLVYWAYKRAKAKKKNKILILIILLLLFLIGKNMAPCLAEQSEKAQKENAELQKETVSVTQPLKEDDDTDKLKPKENKSEVQEKPKPEPKKEQPKTQPTVNYSQDKDCSDFSNEHEATDFMKASINAGHGDHRLDRNKDGIACN
jgi:outer membrane biosynthesis protein TonB